MSPTTAILTGSAMIAAAIVASAALFLPARTSDLPAAQPAAAPAQPAVPRYQIVKVESGASWRLDSHTGELTFCRMDADRMICANSAQSVELPRLTPEELKKERDRAEAERDRWGSAMMDKFMSFFDRMVKLAERGFGKAPEPMPDDGPRTL